MVEGNITEGTWREWVGRIERSSEEDFNGLVEHMDIRMYTHAQFDNKITKCMHTHISARFLFPTQISSGNSVIWL